MTTGVVHLDPAARCPASMVTVEYQALVERAIDARRHELHALREDRGRVCIVEQRAQLVVLGLRGELLGEAGAQLLDLLLQRRVLATWR